jgi:hypothetical protein
LRFCFLVSFSHKKEKPIASFLWRWVWNMPITYELSKSATSQCQKTRMHNNNTCSNKSGSSGFERATFA